MSWSNVTLFKYPLKNVLSKSTRKILNPPKTANNHPVVVLEICILQAYINKFLGSLPCNEKTAFDAKTRKLNQRNISYILKN